MKPAAFGLAAALLAGCAGINDGYPWRLEGEPVEALVERYGPPDAVEGDGTVYVYEAAFSRYVPGRPPGLNRQGRCETRFNPDTGQSERVCRQTLSGAAGRNPEMIESDCRLAAQIDGDGRIARIDGAEGDCVYVDAALRDGTDAPD